MGYRDYKIFAAENYYHVFNRGNGKNDIFFEPQDYGIFLHRLSENLFPEHEIPKTGYPLDLKFKRKKLPAGAFSLICYCLMPNHFHLLVRQNSEVKISELIQKLCTGYSKYFQKKYDHVGHLFQGTFKAIHVDNESYLTWLSAYIHQNPATASIVNNLEDYPYSSYLDYIGLRDGKLCDKAPILDKFKSKEDYKKFVLDTEALFKAKKSLKDLMLD